MQDHTQAQRRRRRAALANKCCWHGKSAQKRRRRPCGSGAKLHCGAAAIAAFVLEKCSASTVPSPQDSTPRTHYLRATRLAALARSESLVAFNSAAHSGRHMRGASKTSHKGSYFSLRNTTSQTTTTTTTPTTTTNLTKLCTSITRRRRRRRSRKLCCFGTASNVVKANRTEFKRESTIASTIGTKPFLQQQQWPHKSLLDNSNSNSNNSPQFRTNMVPIPTANSASNNQRGAHLGASSSATSSASNAKSSIQEYLTNCKSLYSCIYCRTHLANHDELVSRSFQVQRELNTGSHAVADIFCGNCETTLGWKYEKAYVETQKYKEGKYIIELAHVVRENRHLELDKGEIFFGIANNNNSSSNNNGTSSSSRLTRKQHDRISLEPSSPSQCSSPSSGSSTNYETYAVVGGEELDEDDEELMFPFYDDLCSSRSSYPSSLSSSHHNRMRRSLYLDSTPYDWKHSATSSSSSPPLSLSTSSSPPSPSVDAKPTTTTKTSAARVAADGAGGGVGEGVASATTISTATAGQSIKRATQVLAPTSSSSLGSSSDLSLSASSSSSSASTERRTHEHEPLNQQAQTSDSNDTHKKSSKFNDDNGRHASEPRLLANKRAKADRVGAGEAEETQFNFEEDRPEVLIAEQQQQQQQSVHPEQQGELAGNDELGEVGSSHLNADTQRAGERASTDNLSSENIPTTVNNNNTKNARSWGKKSNRSDKAEPKPPNNEQEEEDNDDDDDDDDDEANDINNQQPVAGVSNVATLSRSNANSNSSISLDDEEFYDCYTDHDVSNMMIASESNSTLKVAE